MGLTAAALVGVLFAAGAYLVLRREPIGVILGLSLITYGTNALLFSSSTLARGVPPIIEDKAAFTGDISRFVDPLPQALVLTAIVISFGVTAFMVVLFNRRNDLLDEAGLSSTDAPVANDPFAADSHFLDELDRNADDYEWLDDELDHTRRAGAVDDAANHVENDIG
ncbi:MAG: NADH-quinone oxidoreductase subunit K [Caldilineaceae bacterium]|nr:NADH-quinone oxidoreductase subunit K [Caldilineaceae bacterium]